MKQPWTIVQSEKLHGTLYTNFILWFPDQIDLVPKNVFNSDLINQVQFWKFWKDKLQFASERKRFPSFSEKTQRDYNMWLNNFAKTSGVLDFWDEIKKQLGYYAANFRPEKPKKQKLENAAHKKEPENKRRKLKEIETIDNNQQSEINSIDQPQITNGGSNIDAAQSDRLFTHGKVVEYNSAILEDKRCILFAGLYPPPNATEDDQYSNRTSTMISSIMGHQDFFWIDLFVLCPEICSDIRLDALNKRCDDFIRNTWKEKIISACKKMKDNMVPVIYVCGQICGKQWDILNFKSVKVENDCGKNIAIVYLDEHTPTICFMDCHPSATLHRPSKKELVKENMLILNELNSKTPEIMNNCKVSLKHVLSEFRQQQWKAIETFLTGIGIDMDENNNACEAYLQNYPWNVTYEGEVYRVIDKIKMLESDCYCKSKTTCHKEVKNCLWRETMIKLCKIARYRCFWNLLLQEDTRAILLYLFQYVHTIQDFLLLLQECNKIKTCVQGKYVTIDLLESTVETLNEKEQIWRLLLNSGFYFGLYPPNRKQRFLTEIVKFLEIPHLRSLILDSSELMKSVALNNITFDHVKSDLKKYEPKQFTKLYDNVEFISNRKKIDVWRIAWDKIYSPVDIDLIMEKNRQFITKMDDASFQNFISRFWDKIESVYHKSAKETIKTLLNCETFCVIKRPNEREGEDNLFDKRFQTTYEEITLSTLGQLHDPFELTVKLCSIDNFVHPDRESKNLVNRFVDLYQFFQLKRKLNQNDEQEVLEKTMCFFQIVAVGKRLLNDNYFSLLKAVLDQYSWDFAVDFFQNPLLEKLYPMYKGFVKEESPHYTVILQRLKSPGGMLEITEDLLDVHVRLPCRECLNKQ